MSLLATVNGRGTLAARPAAAAANEGYIYSASDASLYRSNGTSWDTIASTGLADQGTFTYLDGTVAAAPATPAAGKLRMYAKTGKVLAVKDDAGLETVLGGGITKGTANPGSPSDGDLFYRSDLDLLIRYRSTGTRWVCVCPHTLKFDVDTAQPLTGGAGARAAKPSTTLSIWAENFWCASYVVTTNDGTNYWTIALDVPSVTLSTISNAPNAVVIETAAVNAVIDATSWLSITYTKVANPGSLYPPTFLSYRYIVT